ncbi:MAG: hypothetical protein JXR30_02220 [Alphaproteobacteria bacterium]|nr:hypothetical protein [Alphaproteobacteria bacterium]
MEKQIKSFHRYQVLNGVLLVIVISLLMYALYPLVTQRTEDEKIEEKIAIETGFGVEKKDEDIVSEEANIQEKKGQTLEEAKKDPEAEQILDPKKPQLLYKTVQMRKTEIKDIPTLDFSTTTFQEQEHKGDMRILGQDCSKIPPHLRIVGDLHIYGLGTENCVLPKGLSVVGSVYVKSIKSIRFQNDLKIQKKIYIQDQICVSVPIGGADKIVLSDGVQKCE